MSITSYVSGLVIQSVPTRGKMKVDRFTASGTWTVPAGVTYAVAHIRGGGGGTGYASNGTGGTSSVAFASGTVSALGGNATANAWSGGNFKTMAGMDNSGYGAAMHQIRGADPGDSLIQKAQDGAYIVAGADVTPAASITITVGAGGTAGTSGAAGGSGYVWIEYLA
jgi:hypothetical protein